MSAHILIVSMYYWPEETGNAPYVTDLAEHLADAGHQVTVLAGLPHYPSWRVADRYRKRFRLTEEHERVEIVRRWHAVPRRQSAVRRVLYEGSFFLNAATYRPRADAVIGMVPSLSGGLLARVMAARARAAYGLVIQDLVGAAATQSGIAGGARAATLVRRAESWMTGAATVVAPVTDAFVPYLVDLGVAPARIQVLPNWSRLSPPTAARQQTRRELGWRDDELVALHAGNMGLKQGLEQIVEAARLAQGQGSPIRFVLMGDGNQRHRLEALAEGNGSIVFRPFVEREQLANVLAAADALLVSERPSMQDMSMPSKLTAYFVAGRPIVAAVNPDGATARELRRARAGVVVPAGQPAALVNALLGLGAGSAAIDRLAANGQRYAQTVLSKDAILGRASRLVDGIIQRTAAIRGHGGR